MRRRKYWGWGYEDEGLSSAEEARLGSLLATFFGVTPAPGSAPPPVEALGLPASRLPSPPPASFASSVSAYDRVLHAGGRSYRDLVRFRSGRVDHPPDLVAFPASVSELVACLEWVDRVGAAVIPFGGGTSVTGGVEPAVPARFSGTVSLDLSRLNRVLAVDPLAQLVHVEAGILGPDLDAALKPHGLSIRHYPQSYYFSTVGGWIATRSGGHYSTLLGKIDTRVCALEVVAPNGTVGATRKLPSSSIGPDPNALWIGSEGLLGVITKAWLRVHPLPRFKKTVGVQFQELGHALEAARRIVQAGLYPVHLRVLDPFEAMMSAAFTSGLFEEARPVLILGFESAAQEVDAMLEAALAQAAACGGKTASARGTKADEVEGWRHIFFRQPYVRDTLIGWGLIADTFETAIPWDRAEAFYHEVREATLEAVEEQCGAGAVLGRTTHAYPDGVAFYFTFFGRGRPGEQLEQWSAIKKAATDAVARGGGTASHHHACGRDHAPWSEQELPSIWKAALLGAKAALDPRGAMNPGVVFP
jgi:alkyldihydroxyacetonephosphate synthase